MAAFEDFQKGRLGTIPSVHAAQGEAWHDALKRLEGQLHHVEGPQSGSQRPEHVEERIFLGLLEGFGAVRVPRAVNLRSESFRIKEMINSRGRACP